EIQMLISEAVDFFAFDGDDRNHTIFAHDWHRHLRQSKACASDEIHVERYIRHDFRIPRTRDTLVDAAALQANWGKLILRDVVAISRDDPELIRFMTVQAIRGGVGISEAQCPIQRHLKDMVRLDSIVQFTVYLPQDGEFPHMRFGLMHRAAVDTG